MPFPWQLYGATQRLRLARSQHTQQVRQLREEMAQLVPAGRVAELQRLLEGEWRGARWLQVEAQVSGDQAWGPAGGDWEGEYDFWFQGDLRVR